MVVLGLHLSDPANTLTVAASSGCGHWSMSTFRKSISIPLVPLKRTKKQGLREKNNLGKGEEKKRVHTAV